MTREELVEKVARAMAAQCVERDDEAMEPDFDWEPWTPEARAAIRVVLEEAASLAVESDAIANAIRALKPGDENE